MILMLLFAVYAISYLLVEHEDFGEIRAKLIGFFTRWKTIGFLINTVFNCQKCMSFWTALFLGFLLFFKNIIFFDIIMIIVFAFASFGFTLVVKQLNERFD